MVSLDGFEAEEAKRIEPLEFMDEDDFPYDPNDDLPEREYED